MKNEDNSNNANKARNAKGADAKGAARKQKRQIMVLSGLAVVLVAVLFIQFSGSDPEYEAAALADVDLEQPDAAPADAGQPAEDVPVAKDNPVLLKDDEDEGLLRNAFTNFWDGAASADNKPVVEVTPPSVTLTGTLPGGKRQIAIIDGQLHFLGDMIDGWKLTGINSREIVLTGPTDTTVTVGMPVIFGRVSVPDELKVPAEEATEPTTDGDAPDGTSAQESIEESAQTAPQEPAQQPGSDGL